MAGEVEHSLTTFPPQERSLQASSAPHCATIGEGHTGKISLTLSSAFKLAFFFSNRVFESLLWILGQLKSLSCLWVSAQVSALQVLGEYS